jgi:fructose-1-phosphate kinase PfkB-like protein
MKVSSLIVGLNPALQKRLVLPGPLTAGDVHRVSDVQTGIGGKGQDVVVALHCLGISPKSTRLLQFLGTGGEALQEQLNPLVEQVTVPCTTRLRTCTSLVAPDDTTELVEPSGEVSATEVTKLKMLLEETITQSLPSGVAFMGSVPPGCPSDIYAQLFPIFADKASAENCVFVVDSVVGFPQLLETIDSMSETAHGPILWKVNVAELCSLVQYKPEPENKDNDQATVQAALSKLITTYPKCSTALDAIALTNGARPAFVAFPNDKTFTLTEVATPRLSTLDKTVLYPIGAGDAVAAGTLAAWQVLRQTEKLASSTATSSNDDEEMASSSAWETALRKVKQSSSDDYSSNDDIITAFSFGLACGSASCLQEENSVLEVDTVVNLFQNMAATVAA